MIIKSKYSFFVATVAYPERNGIRPMKKELFDRFLSTYDMEFSEDFCFVAKLKEVLSEEVDAFLWLDKNKQKKVRERFRKIKEKAEKSYACFLKCRHVFQMMKERCCS